ncbi:MAG TPA: MltR family transcriptional regulator [Rhizomicrobium sp.]|jgi:hypothetical protein
MSKNKQKRTLHDLGHDTPTFEETQQMAALVHEGPDIVRAIVAAAIIEHELERLIFDRLRRNDEGTIRMLARPEGPLTSLSAKALLAYALGIIDDVYLYNIGIVRHIRNAFAHAKRPITFTTPEIVAAIAKVRLPTNKRAKDYKSLEIVKSPEAAPGECFRILNSNIQIYLLKRRTKLAKRKTAYHRRKQKESESGNYFGSLAKLLEDNPHWLLDPDENVGFSS